VLVIQTLSHLKLSTCHRSRNHLEKMYCKISCYLWWKNVDVLAEISFLTCFGKRCILFMIITKKWESL